MKTTIQSNEIELYNLPALVLLLVAVIVSGFVIKLFVLGGSTPIHLKPAPELSGAISQSLASTNAATALPRNGTDYRLKNTSYFDSDIWVVTSIVPTGADSNQSIVILHKSQGIYRVVPGPGTAFASTQLSGLPGDVTSYLSRLGVVYEPAN